MSNKKFPRLNKPRITRYAATIAGQPVPFRTASNSAITGNYIDTLVKRWAGASLGIFTVVDLDRFGIEIKSKDIETASEWTIGSSTFNDIINKSYVDSSLYQKLQALFLVEYNNVLSTITSANLYYMDNDDCQTLLQEGYEAARKSMIVHQLNIGSNISNNLFVFANQHQSHTYKKYQRIPGTPGFCFERCESTNSFSFRITKPAMRKLVKLAVANNNTQFDFQ